MAMPMNVDGDDSVIYEIFPNCPADGNSTELSSCDELEQRRTEYLAFLGQYLVDYIWQNKAFHLRPIIATGD